MRSNPWHKSFKVKVRYSKKDCKSLYQTLYADSVVEAMHIAANHQKAIGYDKTTLCSSTRTVYNLWS